MGTPLVHVQHNSVIENAWIKYSDIPALKRRNVQILQGRVVEIDPLQKRAFWRGTKSPADEPDRLLQYDYLIAATGLQRDWPILPKSQTKQQYIQDAKSHIMKIKGSRDYPIVVVGGGMYMLSVPYGIRFFRSNSCIPLNRSRWNRVRGRDQTPSPGETGNTSPFSVYCPVE